MHVTPYDRVTFVRTTGFGLALCALALLVMWATDGAAGWNARLARLGALAPVLGAIAVAMAAAQARWRGEPLALAAIGVSHARMTLGPLAALTWIGTLGAILLGWAPSDPSALFPSLHERTWTPLADGWLSPADGIVVRAGFTVEFVEPLALASQPPLPSRSSLVLVVLGATAALGVWMAAELRPASRLILGTCAVLASLVAFHLVAAGRTGPWILASGPAILAAHAASRVAYDRRRHAGPSPARNC
jgi:hypothetical protein